ncbi:hypothetical protein REPUB_Repub04eG0034600 [Reevesia pubescens]
MSPEEIAQAQAEMMEKMDPALLNLLKKRGQEKLKKRKDSSLNLAANSELGISHENQSNNAIDSSDKESNNSKMVTTRSNITKSGLDNGMDKNVDPVSVSLWNAWSQRVEAVRELRFSLDGTVVENDVVRLPETRQNHSRSYVHLFSGDNVAERDCLRTEGDPGAAGYTIKEAVTLTRSTIIASTLANNNKVDGDVDWEAVWAFAVGPKPELILSLRMSLDDNHNSVVLASAKVIKSILSCDLNEDFFDFWRKQQLM